MLLLLLEDDADRIRGFTSILGQSFPDLIIRHWPTAPGFIQGFQTKGHRPALICLDHDLVPASSGDPDPGDSRDVAAFLATQRPVCPVLIHSTNVSAANSMRFTLEDAGWSVEKVTPMGDDWIGLLWVPAARRLLGAA